ncbi:MAG: hypothetical protein ACT6FE_07150 [Methanosarcinaceae archaeon]
METCVICGQEQDTKLYDAYNICTTCADIMEDVMGEYFIRTILHSKPKAHGGYLKYLNNTTKYISDYKKLTVKSHNHTKDISRRAADAIGNSDMPSKQRYFERMQEVLDWLGKCPQFYHYYFKDYYLCPTCGASIFEKYSKDEVGDWVVVSCSNCSTVIKKYFSLKTV